MRFVHLSTVKELSGLYSVDVLINGREYSYTLRSFKDMRMFMTMLSHGWYGRALNFLKKYDVSISNK
jgi:hypothetical protein